MTERNFTIKDYEPISESVWNKAYTVAQGVWKERNLLPVTHNSYFNRILGVSPMMIPLVEDNHLELGRFGIGPSGEETVYIEVYTHNKNGKTNNFGTNLTSAFSSKFGGIDSYNFWIFFDNFHDTSQVKIIRYLATLNPIRKFDWDHIRPRTSEMELALSMSHMVFEAQQRQRRKSDRR